MLKTPLSDSLKGDTLRAFVSIALPTFEYHKKPKSKKDHANALYPMDFSGTVFLAGVNRKIGSFHEYSDGQIEEHSHELDIFAANGQDPDPNTDTGRVYCKCCGRYYIKDGIWEEVYGGELDEMVVRMQEMIKDSGIGLFCSMYPEYCGEREPCPKCQKYSCICPKPDTGDGGKDDPPKTDPGDSGDPNPEPKPEPKPNFPPTNNTKLNKTLTTISDKLPKANAAILSKYTFRLSIMSNYPYVAQLSHHLGLKYAVITLNEESIDKASEEGLILVISHEIFHILLYNRGFNDGNIHHDMMVDGDGFRDFLKTTIPGMSDEWYEKAKYSGSYGATNYDRGVGLDRFFKDYKIPN